MSWSSHFEQWNAPHIGRGTLLAIIYWRLGAWLFSLHWAMTFCAIAVFVSSVLWELCDQQRYEHGHFLFWKTASDPFDWQDILADMTGMGLFALAIWVYQISEKAFYNWGGVF